MTSSQMPRLYEIFEATQYPHPCEKCAWIHFPSEKNKILTLADNQNWPGKHGAAQLLRSWYTNFSQPSILRSIGGGSMDRTWPPLTVY
ncbi:uncharacterized protein VTP21DRAFT_7671 [Calcarisporiella thermophila]|uniref:uncharacterized protein n=1 Tax=Calcarisporiella thermophila TaxID=911321 RepID=UPI00374227DA